MASVKALFCYPSGRRREVTVVARAGNHVKLLFSRRSRWESTASIEAVPENRRSKINQQRAIAIIGDGITAEQFADRYWESGKALTAAALTVFRLLEKRGVIYTVGTGQLTRARLTAPKPPATTHGT